MTPSPQLSPRIAALLAKTRAVHGRLIFALDATASRQPTWDLACSLQSEMFEQVAALGGLEVQLVFFRGIECKSSVWTCDPGELARSMRRIVCEAGNTQIGKVLAHVRTEHAREKVAAVIFVGDALEETPSSLYDAATIGQPPWFFFQEGNAVEVATAFKELARLTNGAHCQFNAGAGKQLRELLAAVAVFAAGGVKALASQNTDGARRLLGQMR